MTVAVRNILAVLGGAAAGYLCWRGVSNLEAPPFYTFRSVVTGRTAMNEIVAHPADAWVIPLLALVFIVGGAVVGRLLAFRPSTSALLRTLYLVGLASWVIYVILYPAWVGRSYSPDDRGSTVFHQNGTFGLQGGAVTEMKAPLWAPPRPHSDSFDASVRWPLQTVRKQYYVELDLDRTAMRLSLGVLVLGLLLGAGAWMFTHRQPDVLVSLALCLSLAQVIAWVCILAIAAFTFGFGLFDGVVFTILALGIGGGGAYAVWTLRRHFSTSVFALAAGVTAPEATLTEGPSPAIQVMGAQPRKAPACLLWFTVGIVAAACLTAAAGWIASSFRGPVVGGTELGTPRYAKDQIPINFITGAGILAAGWLIGLMTYRLRTPRALSVGLLVGTTLLGITFAFWR